MLSGREDKASIDSDTKLFMVCVWPESSRGYDNAEEKRKIKTEKENEIGGKVTQNQNGKSKSRIPNKEITGKIHFACKVKVLEFSIHCYNKNKLIPIT